MRKALILALVLAFLAGCSTSNGYRGVNSKPKQAVLKMEE